MPPRAVWLFFVGIRKSIEDERHKVAKVTCFTVHFAVPPRAARIWQPYRGFALLGRWGPQTVRSGQRVGGKIRYFGNEDCAFPAREARSVRGSVNPIAKVGRRGAGCVVIYVGLAPSVFAFASTIGNVGRRIADFAVIPVLSFRVCQHYRRWKAQSGKSDVFYRALCGPPPGSPDLATLSRIRASRALGPANGATRPESRR